jgi:hypothetical protein
MSALCSTALAWPLAVRAQQPGKVYRIAFFSAGTSAGTPALPAFVEGLTRRACVANGPCLRQSSEVVLFWGAHV